MKSTAHLRVEEIPLEIRKHISLCDCRCDHMSYGNYQSLREQEGFSVPPLPATCRVDCAACLADGGPSSKLSGPLPQAPLPPSHRPICDLVSDHVTPLQISTFDLYRSRDGIDELCVSGRHCSGCHGDPSRHPVRGVTTAALLPQSGIVGLQSCQLTHSKTAINSSSPICRVSWAVCTLVAVAVAGSVGVGVPLALRLEPLAGAEQRLMTARQLLQQSPLVDGHNDLAWNIRKFLHNNLRIFNFTADLRRVKPWSKSSWSHTDIGRLREGRVAAQFWAAYVPCEAQFKNAVQMSLEQVDLIRRLVLQYSDHMSLALSSQDIIEGHAQGRLVSLIGLEGGHSIQSTLSVLRVMYLLGVRYMTLTHTCHTPWAESSSASERDRQLVRPEGLTEFGLTVVREMNRLGMMIDLSHVSSRAAETALTHSKAPVLFSHSSAKALCNSRRNVSDRLLKLLVKNGGIVMISFYSFFLTCNSSATIGDVIAHINHVRQVAGVDHVGIGAGYDGINLVPVGLEDVSKYPHLFAQLLTDPSWTIEDLHKLAGLNFIRVFRQVEQTRDKMREEGVAPLEQLVPAEDLAGTLNCTYRLYRQQHHHQQQQQQQQQRPTEPGQEASDDVTNIS